MFVYSHQPYYTNAYIPITLYLFGLFSVAGGFAFISIDEGGDVLLLFAETLKQGYNYIAVCGWVYVFFSQPCLNFVLALNATRVYKRRDCMAVGWN